MIAGGGRIQVEHKQKGLFAGPARNPGQDIPAVSHHLIAQLLTLKRNPHSVKLLLHIFTKCFLIMGFACALRITNESRNGPVYVSPSFRLFFCKSLKQVIPFYHLG